MRQKLCNHPNCIMINPWLNDFHCIFVMKKSRKSKVCVLSFFWLLILCFIFFSVLRIADSEDRFYMLLRTDCYLCSMFKGLATKVLNTLELGFQNYVSRLCGIKTIFLDDYKARSLQYIRYQQKHFNQCTHAYIPIHPSPT